jgi:hypothetical protein
MRGLLVALALLVAGVIGLGFYRGWFDLSADATDPKASVTFTVDQDKIHGDADRAGERVRDFGHTVREATGGKADKVRE